MELTPASWLIATLAALIVGASKSGVPGGGVLAVALFAQIFPAAFATIVVIPAETPMLAAKSRLAIAAKPRHPGAGIGEDGRKR